LTRPRAALGLAAVMVLVVAAVGCGSDSSGDTESITLPTVSTETPTLTTPTETSPIRTNTDTVPNVSTTPPQTTTTPAPSTKPKPGSPESNFNQYCKQYPGACGD
jgi:hypothetical protein